MSDPVLDIDAHLRARLALPSDGPPTAPSWFVRTLADAPEQRLIEVEEAVIEMLTWGERGRPGLLFVHGGAANADWWDHIAPYFAAERRVAALSLSGNGGSGWRPHYDVGQLAREMGAVARAAGLYEAGAPVFVGHSFGSRPLLAAAADGELAPGAAIVVDAAVSPPDRPEYAPPPGRAHPVYPTLEAALARFRLIPAQPCENLFILDHIARRSVREVEGGWSWRFDPFQLLRISGASSAETTRNIQAARCPLAFLYGEQSAIVGPETLAYTRSIAPQGTLFSAVPEARHHVFLDQPLAFVAALRTLLAELDR
jgi:pimeloyl-ACP methyl ester carboxylesterase